MKPTTRVNVIVVARDLWDITRKCLESMIFTMSAPWRLVFVDNGSEDETREAFEEIAKTWSWQYFNGYDVISTGRPMAVSVGWNRGFARIDPDATYTLFANNDIVFHQHGWWDRFQALIDGGIDLVGLQEMTWYRFRFVEGSLFAARTKTFLQLADADGKLFDQQFKLSCEDVDLSERFLRAGLRIGQVPGLQPDYLVHIGHASLSHHGAREDLKAKMHESRERLCKKYDYEVKVAD